MKKKIFLFITLTATIASASSQHVEIRTLPSFSKIGIESKAKIYLRQDSVQSVRVSTEGLLSKVETTVYGHMLRISGNENAELDISVPRIENISISGSGEVIGQPPITSDQLELDISGDGKIVLDIRIKELKIEISGLGKITLSGSAENTELKISGSGKVDALAMQTTNCKANISGMGKCLIDVTDNLTSDISGNGMVSYKNPPKNISKDISGLGRISMHSSLAGKADTTRFELGKSHVLIISEKDSANHPRKSITKPIWSGFEMGFNSYINSSWNFDLPPGYQFLELKAEKSISVGLNLFQKNIELGHSNIWFFTGLGITWNNYRFENNVTINATSPISASVDSMSNINHIKSKLTVSYLTAPFMLEVFTSRNPKKAFHIGAGALVGVRLMSHTKQKFEIDGNTFKPKIYSDFGLNPFRLGVRVATGIHRLNFFADYYFSTLLKNGKGPSLYPVNIGITLAGF